jgi:CheY-like chemotaxis protein
VRLNSAFVSGSAPTTIQTTRGSDRFEIKPGTVVLDIAEDSDGIRISVEDTGVGIPPDQLTYVFEKFRQVDGSSTRKVGGTGLGLAIVRELSRLLDGTVDVKSTLGRGTTFTVTLPGLVAGATIKPAPEQAAPNLTDGTQAPKVLIVDDDPLIHQLLRGELENEGFEVLLASDGIEALQLARTHRPSAVILDLHLPRLDGWGVLAELKSDPSLASVPVVLLSVEEHRARGFSLGAVEYLVKPVEPQRLVSVVGRLTTTGGGEILVVDDDADTRSLVARSLQNAGFNVAQAQNGDEALLRLRVSPPALLILDLVMPGRNGFEVLEQARSEGLDVPVVVLTGKSLTASEQQILRDGMAAVVQKGGRSIEAVVAEARRTVAERQRERSGRLARILYVEDSPQNRDVVRRYLQGVYDVIEAEDGEYGVERAKRDNPALILMDLSLPRMDGWEATRRIKADDAIKSIPVLALTAHASREDQNRARAAGCDDYLTKPVDRDQLLEAIRRHLVGRKDV